MTAQLTLPVCAVPGCRLVVGEWGEVCQDCTAAFGPMLRRNTGGQRLTQDELAERDQGVTDTYTAQLRAEMIAEAEKAAEKAVAIANGAPERKAMQQCWMCDERHVCTRINGRWECDRCQDIE